MVVKPEPLALCLPVVGKPEPILPGIPEVTARASDGESFSQRYENDFAVPLPSNGGSFV